MPNDPAAHAIASQMLAALYTLKDCIDRCPDKDWNERQGDYPFSQVVFHTLFDIDYCLCEATEGLKEQAFHKDNKVIFDDYEELKEEWGPKHLYERGFIIRYYEHCKGKVATAIETKTAAELTIPRGDVRKNMTKLERYVNVIRHTQHHAAQLGLRLQFASGKEMDWVSRGYDK